MENKEKFIRICKQWIKRKGIEELLSWLEESDFFIAPASTRFHNMFRGGLCAHSINVFNRLKQECEDEGLFAYKTKDETNSLMETITIISLFHDLAKVNFYEVSMRNVKDENGIWTKVPYYTINNKSNLVGHGYKSARIVNKFMDLSDEEYMAIAYHMGYSMEKIEDVSEIFSKNILSILLHSADTKATFIDEKEER